MARTSNGGASRAHNGERINFGRRRLLWRIICASSKSFKPSKILCCNISNIFPRVMPLNSRGLSTCTNHGMAASFINLGAPIDSGLSSINLSSHGAPIFDGGFLHCADLQQRLFFSAVAVLCRFNDCAVLFCLNNDLRGLQRVRFDQAASSGDGNGNGPAMTSDHDQDPRGRMNELRRRRRR